MRTIYQLRQMFFNKMSSLMTFLRMTIGYCHLSLNWLLDEGHMHFNSFDSNLNHQYVLKLLSYDITLTTSLGYWMQIEEAQDST
jgi:hypothetical protein